MTFGIGKKRGFDRARGLATLVAGGIGVATVLPAITLHTYGAVMFLLMPFNMGLAAAVVDAWRERRGLLECFLTALIPGAVLISLLLVLGIEGLICIAMAVPIMVPLLFLGALAGFGLQRHRGSGHVTASMVILAPLSLLLGPHGPDHAIDTVITAIVVNAPPASVWRYVASIPDLPAPTDLLFRAGVAYPVATKIQGEDVGAGRQCILSTGIMTERVTAWRRTQLLRFEVLSTPPAMKELSPWPNVDPPHLHGFYVSKEGEFRLTGLSGDRTLLEGQSWYQHGLEPVSYWNVWTRYIVHRVHIRVLMHIKKLAEEDARLVRTASR